MGDYVDIVPHHIALKNSIPVGSMSGIKFQIKTQSPTTLNCDYGASSFQITFGRTISIVSMRDSAHAYNLADVEELLSPDLLDGEWHEYWINWSRDKVGLGVQGSLVPAITKNAPGLKSITCIEPASNAFWKFELGPIPPKIKHYSLSGGEPTWVHVEDSIPPGAVIGGHENEPLYIIRAQHSGSLTPGKFIISEGTAYISWGGQAIEKESFEVLVGYNFKWVPSANGHVPNGALLGGRSENRDEPLYVGRVHKDGHLIVGKVQPSHGGCYIAYGGQEVQSREYEVLVTKEDPRVALIPMHADFNDWIEQGRDLRMAREVYDSSDSDE